MRSRPAAAQRLAYAARMRPGLYLAHKRPGETSFSQVAALLEEARLAGIRKDKLPVCHGGALDPFAEGLLLLLAGPATRLMELIHAAPKTYQAQISWGAETDNGDLLGRVVREGDASLLTEAALEAALQPLLGWTEQVPPAHSNKRVGGERAYLRAHRGEAVELPASRVYLHQARFLEHDLPRWSRLSLVCRGGYYVRSLARDLGRALGCGAHLGELRRTAIGPWLDPGTSGLRGLISGEALLPWCPSRRLSEREAHAAIGRRAIERGSIEPPDWLAPAGFPLEPRPLVRGLREGKLIAMLREEGAGLLTQVTLGAGI